MYLADKDSYSYIQLKESAIIPRDKAKSFKFSMKFNALYRGYDSIGLMVGTDGSTFYYNTARSNDLRSIVQNSLDRGPILGFRYYSIKY
jgi:hypothetical protein